jgi:hypothetical protein
MLATSALLPDSVERTHLPSVSADRNDRDTIDEEDADGSPAPVEAAGGSSGDLPPLVLLVCAIKGEMFRAERAPVVLRIGVAEVEEDLSDDCDEKREKSLLLECRCCWWLL